ncbi:MAG TPA: methyltransferase domain-containing protein [Solirubrobacteraceae bacterium]|nr:methyltransferase domain-containing protein [Solirubrobacteraceae bacterium]
MEDSRTTAARTHFDRWSETYERGPGAQRLQGRQTAALASLALNPEDVLLDLACGTGAAVREAAVTVRRAVGLDLSPSMIDQARMLAGSLDNVEFRIGDVSGPLPFDDGEFTAIVCTTAFHHFPRPLDTVAEMYRVLAPGGRVVIADFNRRNPVVFAADLALKRLQASHIGLRSPGQLIRDLGGAGFARASVCTVSGRSYAFVRAEKVD